MGMSAGGSGGGSGGRRGGRGGRRRGGAISEINVTPLVDVMLVLLIIFMVAAPMMTQTSANALNSDTQPITISVNANGQIHLQETEIQAAEVADKLQAIATTGYNERIFVRADSVAAYGVVADVMARIQAAGFKNIGLVTQQKQDN
jgi:biopolymer transport protein TolR